MSGVSRSACIAVRISLASSDSVTASVVAAGGTPPLLSVVKSGSALTFSWTDATFKLQSQTNSLTTGLYTNWSDYPGGGASPVGVTINPANPAVFFRLSQ